MSFTASPADRAVDLAWQTGSELDNLGFQLYRATAAAGPYARITRALIPGLGSSPIGASYRYRDTALTNGVTYYYQLEDIETTGLTDRHGPVSATPVSSPSSRTSPRMTRPAKSPGKPGAPRTVANGNPAAVSLQVVEHDSRPRRAGAADRRLLQHCEPGRDRRAPDPVVRGRRGSRLPAGPDPPRVGRGRRRTRGADQLRARARRGRLRAASGRGSGAGARRHTAGDRAAGPRPTPAERVLRG